MDFSNYERKCRDIPSAHSMNTQQKPAKANNSTSKNEDGAQEMKNQRNANTRSDTENESRVVVNGAYVAPQHVPNAVTVPVTINYNTNYYQR